MSEWIEYAIIRVESRGGRDERLNVGLAVFNKNGIDIRICKDLDKVRAMVKNMNIEQLRELIFRFGEYLDCFIKQGVDIQDNNNIKFSPLTLSRRGRFVVEEPSDYEKRIKSSMKYLVEPED